MGVCLFRKDVLLEVLENELPDFGQDLIPEAVRTRHVRAHLFEGYWRDIGTIRAFYDAHMDLLSPTPPFDLHDPEWPFYTHPRYLPGARISGLRFNRVILAEGSSIDDSTIEESVVGVRAVMRRATVRRCLIMGADPHPPEAPTGAPPIGIGEGSLLQEAIVDKKPFARETVEAVIDQKEAELLALYRQKHAAIVQKNRQLNELVFNAGHWWLGVPELAGALNQARAFIDNIDRNFGEHAPAWQQIQSNEHRARRKQQITEALLNYRAERDAWDSQF